MDKLEIERPKIELLDYTFDHLLYDVIKYENVTKLGYDEKGFNDDFVLLNGLYFQIANSPEVNHEKEVGIMLMMTVRMMLKYFPEVSPRDVLLTKVVYNLKRFQPLFDFISLTEDNPETYSDSWKVAVSASKIIMKDINISEILDEVRKSRIWSDITNVSQLQLLQESFLSYLGNSIPIEYIIANLGEEINELKYEHNKRNSTDEQSSWKMRCLFELTDIFLYLLNYVILKKYDAGSLISSLTFEECIFFTHKDCISAKINNHINSKRWYGWLYRTKLRWEHT